MVFMNGNKQDILVSIAITTYNGELYLEEQLDSIFNQTFKNIEVVVSDDCSTDDTLKILERYHHKYGLMYSINNTNIGVLKNFEKVINECKGHYIFLSDQDDVWFEDKIEIFIKEIGDFSMIYSDGYLMQDRNKTQNKISEEKWIKPFGLDSNNPSFYKYLIFKSFILGCSLMFKKDLLETTLPFKNLSRNHDWWLAICAEFKDGIKYYNKPLFYYRIHSKNYSLQPSISKIEYILNFFTAKRKNQRMYGDENLVKVLNTLNSFKTDSIEKYNYIKKALRYISMNKNNKNTLESSIFIFNNMKYISPSNNVLTRLLKIFRKLVIK